MGPFDVSRWMQRGPAKRWENRNPRRRKSTRPLWGCQAVRHGVCAGESNFSSSVPPYSVTGGCRAAAFRARAKPPTGPRHYPLVRSSSRSPLRRFPLTRRCDRSHPPRIQWRRAGSRASGAVPRAVHSKQVPVNPRFLTIHINSRHRLSPDRVRLATAPGEFAPAAGGLVCAVRDPGKKGGWR